ncbi:hypothetical protein Q4595_16285 [Wenyingzhuangia sp. 1_MG-2023]|nr:hypothetical protein [Wenyingzhuangia sp. 1_MG-2023]
MTFYNIDGISSTKPNKDNFFIVENQIGDLVFKEGDHTFEIERLCIELRNKLAIKIFGNIEEYHKYLTAPIYPLASLAGIDAEIRVSKAQFEQFIKSIDDKNSLNKLLYYCDVENLIGNIQNSVLETKHLVGEFYRTLNKNSFLIQEDLFTVENGIQYSSGPIVTNITALVNHLFINLYSQLDFITKIIFELENIHTNFDIYPKLKSKSILFGDSKKTSFKEKPDTIYEMTDNIRIIMYLRNEIVHNSSIDSFPKVYQNIKNKKIIEKFILLPDFHNGLIQTFKNRKRFFNDDTKLNKIMPSLIDDFWNKLINTLNQIK